jgi:hypothetical protein
VGSREWFFPGRGVDKIVDKSGGAHGLNSPELNRNRRCLYKIWGRLFGVVQHLGCGGVGRIVKVIPKPASLSTDNEQLSTDSINMVWGKN